MTRTTNIPETCNFLKKVPHLVKGGHAIVNIIFCDCLKIIGFTCFKGTVQTLVFLPSTSIAQIQIEYGPRNDSQKGLRQTRIEEASYVEMSPLKYIAPPKQQIYVDYMLYDFTQPQKSLGFLRISYSHKK